MFATSRRHLLIGLLGCLLLSSLVCAQTTSLRSDTSLRFAPADASFYMTMLHNRRQIDRLLQSRAVARLKTLPMVQLGLAKLLEAWNKDQMGPVRAFLNDPANKELIPLLVDAASHEVFVMSDARFGKWIGTMSGLSNTINMAQMRASLRGQDPEEAVQQELLKVLQNDPDLLKFPNSMFGFKLTNPDVAVRHIARLESHLNEAIDQKAPQLKGRLSRQKIGATDFLTLRLDGSLVPWDELLAKGDLDEETIQKLKERLRPATFTFGLGVRDNYLILYSGENDAALAKLGQGPLLWDRQELEPVRKYADKPVVSVGYVSADFMKQASQFENQIDQMLAFVKTALPLVPADDAVREELSRDVQVMAEQLKKFQPPVGAVCGITFEEKGGYESFSYNFAAQPRLDGSKPLTILDHVGGDPVAFYAARNKQAPEYEEFARHWGGRVVYYVDKIVVPKLSPEQQELFGKVKERFQPLLARLDKANREQLQPGLADSQGAIVVSSKLTNKRWHAAMPPSSEPLPLPELAFVFGVSDAAKVRAGAAECFDVFQDAVKALSEIIPDRVPPIQIPPPMSRTVDNGQLYYYDVAATTGLDPALAPNAGLSNQVLIVSLVPDCTQRLLVAQSISEDGALTKLDRSLATAWKFQMHRLIQLARPWVNYGFEVAKQEGQENEEVAGQVRTILDVLECIRAVTGVSYFEGAALVTHSRSEFQDLAP